MTNNAPNKQMKPSKKEPRQPSNDEEKRRSVQVKHPGMVTK